MRSPQSRSEEAGHLGPNPKSEEREEDADTWKDGRASDGNGVLVIYPPSPGQWR